jgi:copper(I)-binding protein
MTRRQLFLCVGVPWLLWAGSVLAHGTRAGDLTIDHPYAVPTLAGVSTGALYFRAITNNGNEPDHLLSARTKVADSVDLHHMQMDGNVMRMRAVAAIDLPARTEVRLRHGSAAAASEGHHLMLNGLKAPLKDGDRFAVVLQFRRAGEREVMVWVQTPKSRDVGHGGSHQH